MVSKNLKGRNASHKIHCCHQERLHLFSHDWSIKKLRRHCRASTVRQEIRNQVHSWDQERDNQASHMHDTPSKDKPLEEVQHKAAWSPAHPGTHALSAMLYDWAATCPFPAYAQCTGWLGGLLWMTTGRTWKDVFLLLTQSRALSLRYTRRSDALHNSSCKGPPSGFIISSCLHLRSSAAV